MTRRTSRTSRTNLVGLDGEVRRTGKAGLFRYGREQIWIPLKALVPTPEGLCAPQWAIDSALKFNRK